MTMTSKILNVTLMPGTLLKWKDGYGMASDPIPDVKLVEFLELPNEYVVAMDGVSSHVLAIEPVRPVPPTMMGFEAGSTVTFLDGFSFTMGSYNKFEVVAILGEGRYLVTDEGVDFVVTDYDTDTGT